MQIDEQIDILEKQFHNFHPALWEVSYLHWAQISPESLTDVVLVGDRVSCKLMELRLRQKGICPIGEVYLDNDNSCCAYSDKVTFLMTLQDFPGELSRYIQVRDKLIACNINHVSVIHDFSSGFALGAEKLISEKNNIRCAYKMLDGIDSKWRLINFLSQINEPYHWNMDMRAENFGIPDPNRYKPEHEWVDILPMPPKNENTLLIYCSSKEWNDNDPYLNWSQFYSMSMFFLPDMLHRVKFIEFMQKNKLKSKKLYISKKMLYRSCSTFTCHKREFSGGTPLVYQDQDILLEGISIDAISPRPKLGTLVLAVDDEFEDIILGAQDSISADKPMIIIQGFTQADQLWNSVCKIPNLLPGYSISLYRYATENITQGYSIFLKWKEHEKNDKSNT